MSGYRWRGNTARHEAARQAADAQWEHDQLIAGQQRRLAGRDGHGRWQATAVTIQRPVTTEERTS